MACEILTDLQTVGDFLVYPTSCNYYFYLILLGFLMIIITWFLFKAEEKQVGRGDFISSLAVSNIVMTVLASIGTLIEDSDGIPMIQADIWLYFLATTIVITLLWIFKSD